jgi:hypothetical protein
MLLPWNDEADASVGLPVESTPEPHMRHHLPESDDIENLEDTGDWSIGFNGGPKNSLSDAELMANIGKGLRAVYMDVLREPLPDKVAALLRKLDECSG